MPPRVRAFLGRATAQLRADLRSDRFLPFILIGAVLLCGFWFWHRIPNFATRDEKSRLLDAMVPIGKVLAEPSVESLQEGVKWSRVPFGATLYLFGLALLPVVVVAALTGDLDAFTSLGYPHPEFGFYPAWRDTPQWIWTWSLVFVRLFNVAFAVGAVYVTYRLGVAARDRTTGRLAAVLLTLTFGFLTIAHEGGEDMPAAFFLLLALYLALRYVQTDDRALFLAASAAGGLAIAFKLTAVPIVGLIGLAYLLRARKPGIEWQAALWRPQLLVGGASLGLLAILVGFPTFLVGGIDMVIARIFDGSTGRMSHPTGPDAPIWWWFLRGYFSALSLPLFAASVVGAVGGVWSLRDRDTGTAAVALVATGLAAYLLLFSQWHDFRVHHLLPTFPLIALLLAVSLARFHEWRPSVARPAIALLLITSGIYAGVGVLGFASMPRDQATAWLGANADENATMEVYRRDFQDAAIPHDMRINHLFGGEGPNERVDPCPEFVQIGYRDLLYLDNDTYYRNGHHQRLFVRRMVSEEYNFAITAEFGTRPPNFVPQRPEPGSLTALFGHGIVPQTDQFADEQELAANQYTLILERTDTCDPAFGAPF